MERTSTTGRSGASAGCREVKACCLRVGQRICNTRETRVHFNAESYREFGRRYADAYLKLVSAPDTTAKPAEKKAESTATASDSKAFLQFVRAQAHSLRRRDADPAALVHWQQRQQEIRDGLLQAWGGFPAEPAPLAAKVIETIARDGYRVEKVLFQTFPDVWMTANAYVPEGKDVDTKGTSGSDSKTKKLPAVLCVHGHWSGAKQDPHVQARCIGLVKLGFFVLAVDAFGAGERGIGKELGEYHGEMVAATLLPAGRPLSGIQVYENMRAVDYLLTRPEVDGDKLGITGASGGGNQSMYAGAWDRRFKAVVPVCSVGNYQAYLGTACCMCEVVPGALSFTEEAGVLGLTAPRALMVVNATRDSIQFSVGEAKKSLARVEPIYDLYQSKENLRHAIFESPHDYNQPMREAMYGWMTKHLKGEGDAAPIAEPKLQLEEPVTLRCFPGDRRPDDWLTLPQFAARESKRLLQTIAVPTQLPQWESQADSLRKKLAKTLAVEPSDESSRSEIREMSDSGNFTVSIEPGVVLPVTASGDLKAAKSIILVLDIDGQEMRGLAELLDSSDNPPQTPSVVLRLGLRATGAQANPHDAVRRAPDHNTAQWSLWLGRPLLGQWVTDVRGTLDALAQRGWLPQDVTIVGQGPAGVGALAAAALDTRITTTIARGALTSYVSDVPYMNQRLGIIVPGILREVGDLEHIAALIAPRELLIQSPVLAGGESVTAESLPKQFSFTRQVFDLQPGGHFRCLP
jgi:dienelactone hydrolase